MLSECVEHRCICALSREEQSLNGRVATIYIKPGTPQQRSLAHFGFPAADRTAAAHVATGVDGHVPKLASES